MRDQLFVAAHRGGLLTKENHRKLSSWGRKCSEHVLSLVNGHIDERIVHALFVANEWEKGNVPTGDAMKASLGAHAAARESSDPVITAVARSAGQAVAAAHMADHSMGGALYALKAVKLSGKSIAAERAWQDKLLLQLPAELVELIHKTMKQKGKGIKL